MALRVNRNQPGRLAGMEGIWPIFFLLVVLKVPVFLAIWLLWYADPKSTEPDPSADDGGSAKVRPRPSPRRPFGPRRGPHGGGILVKPEPARSRRADHADGVTERARARERSLSPESSRR